MDEHTSSNYQTTNNSRIDDGHYDEQRDAYEQRRSVETFERTGLHESELRRMRQLEKEIGAYDAFMTIDAKREELTALKMKQAARKGS